MEKNRTEQMNNIIIDLKLKIDRLNYTLTALLDINNIEYTSNVINSNDITLIEPDEHKNIVEPLMKSIEATTKVMIRVQNELNKKKELEKLNNDPEVQAHFDD